MIEKAVASSPQVAEPEVPAQPATPADRIFIGFSTTDVFLSTIIRRISGADYSHAWLCHGHQLWGGAWITQADWPTVHSWPYEVATASWSRLMVYEVGAGLYRGMRVAMDESRGLFEERFDVEGLFGMAVITLARKWAHKRLQNPLAHPNELFCSEFVERVLRATGLSPFKDWKPEDSSPKQVYRVCGSQPAYFRRVEPEEFQAWLLQVGLPPERLRPEIIASSEVWAAPRPR